jgi:hypothetical protein
MSRDWFMDKEKLNELRLWTNSKYEEGYTPQEVKDALTRKGFSEKDAEIVISKGKDLKKLMYNLLMIAGVLLFLAVLILLLSSMERIKSDESDVTPSDMRVLSALQLTDIEGISIENFTKSKSNNMLIFTYFDEEHLPVILTIQIAKNNNPSNFSSYFYTLNQESYSDFSIISTWSQEGYDAVDFSYSFEETEFVILQRVIIVGNDVIALNLKCEKEIIDEFKNILDKKTSEIIRIKESWIANDLVK